MEEKKAGYIPQRMCIGCRDMKNKNELIRIVLDDGEPLVDKEQKALKRAFYICRCEKCIALAEKKKAFNRYLKRNAPEGFMKELRACVTG